jgi:hypothetical protein
VRAISLSGFLDLLDEEIGLFAFAFAVEDRDGLLEGVRVFREAPRELVDGATELGPPAELTVELAQLAQHGRHLGKCVDERCHFASGFDGSRAVGARDRNGETRRPEACVFLRRPLHHLSDEIATLTVAEDRIGLDEVGSDGERRTRRELRVADERFDEQ